MSSFNECPYKWFLTYIYKENGFSLEKQNGFFAEFGSYMHKIIQMYLTGILNKDRLSIYYVSHFDENVRVKAPNSKIQLNYFNQGFLYLENISFPNRKILGVEKEVNFVFANKEWTGFIDVVSDDDGKLIITDHKSRNLKPRSNRNTKSNIELDNYLRQLYVYSAAIKAEYGVFPDVLEFNCFRSQSIIQEPFLLNRFYEIEKWAKEQISLITLNDCWFANPNYWKCNYLCDVCHGCEFKA